MTNEQLNYSLFGLAMLGLPILLIISPWASSLWPGLLFVLTLVAGLWLVSLWVQDASIVDIFWGPGIAAMAWWYAFQVGWDNLGAKQFLFLLLVTIWALRLGGYLARRNLGQPEDYRYARMRASAGNNWWWYSFFKVFALQGLIIWIISALFWLILTSENALVWTDYLGILLWTIGFAFEAIGDWQLSRFKRNAENQGQVLDQGLWRYTRHPNYFGEACLWWGYFCLALAHSQAWWMIFSPLFMTFLLLKISGVAMLEADQKDKKESKYQKYIEQTPAFFPWWPSNAR